MSPIITIDQITRPEHAVEYLQQLISGSDLGFQDVVKYDEPLVNGYPAVQIMGGGFTKEIHGTHTWLITIMADIYIMHAKLTDERQTRNYNDLVLATDLIALVEGDPNLLGGSSGNRKVIQGWVESERPGVMPPRSANKPAVVSTQLSWRAINETRY